MTPPILFKIMSANYNIEEKKTLWVNKINDKFIVYLFAGNLKCLSINIEFYYKTIKLYQVCSIASPSRKKYKVQQQNIYSSKRCLFSIAKPHACIDTNVKNKLFSNCDEEEMKL